VLGVHSVARAECDKAPEDCAKEAFEAGISAYQEGRYDVALVEFREAQTLRPHPVVLFNVALAEARSGLILEALAHLEAVYDDPSTPEQLLGKVRTERAATARQVAVVSVLDEEAELVVDGARAEGDPPSIQVNPGDHDVQLLVDGHEVERRTLSLSSGETVKLTVAKPAPPAPEPVPVTEPPPPVEEAPRGVARGWVYGGAGLTVVLTGLTVYSGLDTRRAFRDYQDQVDGMSAADREDRVDGGKSKQRRTNALIGVTSAVGLATAATAGFLVRWSDQSGNASLAVGPGSLVFRRRF
jgi:hypothetical protein